VPVGCARWPEVWLCAVNQHAEVSADAGVQGGTDALGHAALAAGTSVLAMGFAAAALDYAFREGVLAPKRGA
jgi:hypothetical protein